MESLIRIFQDVRNDNFSGTPSKSILYKTLLEELPDPLLLLDQSGKIVMTNSILLEYVGLDKEDVLNTNASLLLDCTKAQLCELIQGNKNNRLRTKIKTHHRKNYIEWHSSAIELADQSRTQILLLGKTRSYTRRRQTPVLNILRKIIKSPFKHPGYKSTNRIYTD